MATFTFGSFGDIITLTQIARKVYDAINSSGSIAQHISASRKDIDTFLSMCDSVDRIMQSGLDIAETDRQVIYNCRNCMLDFQNYLDKFHDKRQVIRIKHRLQFSLSKNNKVSQFENRMRDWANFLSHIQTKYTSLDLKAHITNSLEPWDQKPMQFQDALGRRYPIPLEVCSSYEGLLSFLEFAFKLDPSSHAAVQDRQFWLFMPKLGDSTAWYIVHEGDWRSVARPGARLGISFETSSQLLDSDGNSTDENTGAALSPSIDEMIATLEFQKPMPPWASYDPGTKFELLSPMSPRPHPKLRDPWTTKRIQDTRYMCRCGHRNRRRQENNHLLSGAPGRLDAQRERHGDGDQKDGNSTPKIISERGLNSRNYTYRRKTRPQRHKKAFR